MVIYMIFNPYPSYSKTYQTSESALCRFSFSSGFLLSLWSSIPIQVFWFVISCSKLRSHILGISSLNRHLRSGLTWIFNLWKVVVDIEDGLFNEPFVVGSPGVDLQKDNSEIESSLSIENIFYSFVIEIDQLRQILPEVGDEICQLSDGCAFYFKKLATNWYYFKHVAVCRVPRFEVISNVRKLILFLIETDELIFQLTIPFFIKHMHNSLFPGVCQIVQPKELGLFGSQVHWLFYSCLFASLYWICEIIRSIDRDICTRVDMSAYLLLIGQWLCTIFYPPPLRRALFRSGILPWWVYRWYRKAICWDWWCTCSTIPRGG